MLVGRLPRHRSRAGLIKCISYNNRNYHIVGVMPRKYYEEVEIVIRTILQIASLLPYG